MITLTPEKTMFILSFKDVFDQGKMDEFWESLPRHTSAISNIRIIQFLRQYFHDEFLVETMIPYRMFYYDKNPIWLDKATHSQNECYTPNSHIEGKVDLSNVRKDATELFKSLPICDELYMNKDLHEVWYFIMCSPNINHYDMIIKCNDTTGELIAKKDNDPKIVLDLTNVSDFTTVINITEICANKSNVKIILPANKQIILPKFLARAKILEIDQNTIDFRFEPYLRSDSINIRKFIVHNEQIYKQITNYIKYKHLNASVTLITNTP